MYFLALRRSVWPVVGLILALGGNGCRQKTWTARTIAQDRHYFVDMRKERNIVYRDNQKSDAPLTLVFVHGLGSMKATWNAVAPHYAERYRVILVDLLGHGDSSKPDDDVYSVAHQGEILRRFMVERRLQNVVWVGVSYGAVSVLEAIAPMYERGSARQVKGALLISPPAFPFPQLGETAPFPLKGAVQAVGLAMLRLYNDYTPLTERYVRGLILERAFSKPDRIPNDLVAEYVRVYRHLHARVALRRAARQLIEERKNRTDLDLQYSRITCPVAIVYGTKDTVVPSWVITRLKHILPMATDCHPCGCGHAAQVECPQDVIRSLDTLLSEVLKPAHSG